MAVTDQLYRLDYSPAIPHYCSAMWSVFGAGFGLRCYYTKEEAVKEAQKYFGRAKFTIQLFSDRTSVHILAAPEVDPEDILNEAIYALEEERRALKHCPVHKKKST